MADVFIIEGRNKLEGIVEISGAKNNAGPVLAATLLTEEPCFIENLPLVEDVLNMIKLLESMGVKVEWLGEHKVKIIAGKETDPEKLNLELMEKMRISVLLIGPLLTRFKKFKVSSPGGDRIGLRPITVHLQVLEGLGAKIKKSGQNYFFQAQEPKENQIVLKEFSVTATENLLMAASLLEKEIIIKGAATEPHVKGLEEMLVKMGVKIKGIGEHSLTIKGKRKLNGVSYKVIPDHIETGTFLIIGALTPGSIQIKNINLEDLDLILLKMKEVGVIFEKKENSLLVSYSKNLKATNFQALPWPGFPTDLLPVVVPLLTQAKGKSLIHDPLYENRLNYVSELRKMGADIEIVDPHRAFIFGKTPLSGVKISGWDIRAGASLLTAGLIAKGKTVLENVYQIDRGYEKIDEKLKKLGAKIKRINI